MNQYRTPKSNRLGSAFDLLDTKRNQSCERLPHGQASESHGSLAAEYSRIDPALWGIAKPPTLDEFRWIKHFGEYPGFAPSSGALGQRVDITIADLKQATRVVQYHHYLHRGRTMAQLPYWIKVDGVPVGILLFALPRLSVPLDGIRPLNLLELARMWISPTVQGGTIIDGKGKRHAVAVASCAIGKALRRIRHDWYRKYPKLPNVEAIVCWADDEHHEGTVYRASNFVEAGKSGGSLHGNANRPNGGRDQLNHDYRNIKTRFMYQFPSVLTLSQKRQLDLRNKNRWKPFEEQLYHYSPNLEFDV
jgi:hypothetical protein